MDCRTTIPVGLGDLVEAIHRSQSDPLDQVSDALRVAAQLDALADQLIGHFVNQARRCGASWGEIGRSIGVTKQAAQKRFGSNRGNPRGRARELPERRARPRPSGPTPN